MSGFKCIVVDNWVGNGLDLLPKGIDPTNLAFHGTTELYHDNIIENGLCRGGVPFLFQDGKLMVDILEQLEMPEVINNNRSPLIRIRDYLKNRGNAPLDFTFTGYEAVFYAVEARKGGQIFMAVNDAFEWLDQNHNENEMINQLINLRQRLSEVENSIGTVYAVRFNNQLLDQCKFGLAYNDFAGAFNCLKSFNKFISSDKIVAKIIIPSDYRPNRKIINKAKGLSQDKTKTKGTLAFNLYMSGDE